MTTDHFDWAKKKIAELAATEHPHLRSALQSLVDALRALSGRGGMVFGMASGSLAITDEERNQLAQQIRAGLVEIHSGCVAAGDTELLSELAKIAEECNLPGLLSPGIPIAKVTHPQANWLEIAPSGVIRLQGCNDEWVQQMIEWFKRCYDGPDFDGIDYVRPDAGGDGWLLMGKWTDCLDDEVRVAAIRFVDAIKQAGKAVNDGMSLATEGDAVTFAMTSPAPSAVRVIPLNAYAGTFALATGPLSDNQIGHHVEQTFPALPHWSGIHMGAPHWLGHGVNASERQIHSVAPYIRIDLTDDGHFHVGALATAGEFDEWLAAFLAVTNGPTAPSTDKRNSPWWKFWS